MTTRSFGSQASALGSKTLEASTDVAKAARPPVIMGLDPGSRVAGFAVLQGKCLVPRSPRDFVVVEAGVFKLKASLSKAERLGLLHEALYGMLAPALAPGAATPTVPAPDVCVIETPFYDKNVATALTLGEVRGSFIAACARARVPVAELSPAEVKLAVAGNGRADKDAVSRALGALLGFDRGSLPLDATDALAISLCWGLRLISESLRSGALAGASNGAVPRAARLKEAVP